MTSLDDLLRELRAAAAPALGPDWRALIETDIDNGEIAMAMHSMLQAMGAKDLVITQDLVDGVQQIVAGSSLADDTQAQMLREDLAALKVAAAA